MPTVTNKYPSSLAGGNSLNITVEQGQRIVVVLYASDFSRLPDALQAPVQRQVGAGWQPVPGDDAVPAFITGKVPEIVFGAPGVYRIVVPPTAVAVILDQIS